MALALPHPSTQALLLILWQFVYLTVIFRRQSRFGLGVIVYSAAWYGLLLWVGAPWLMAIMILTAVEAATVAIIALYAPKAWRIVSLVFAIMGMLIIVWGLIGPVSHHWRILTALVIASVVSATTVALIISGFGSFGIRGLGREGAEFPELK